MHWSFFRPTFSVDTIACITYHVPLSLFPFVLIVLFLSILDMNIVFLSVHYNDLLLLLLFQMIMGSKKSGAGVQTLTAKCS